MLADGICAYTCHQAHMHRQLASHFTGLWSGLSAGISPSTDAGEEDEDEDKEELDADEIVDGSGLYIYII
jgi:hypothetical protein